MRLNFNLVKYLCVLTLINGSVVEFSTAQTNYNPTWESIDSRSVPEWFNDAHLGVFIHWGVYSVPSWAPTGQYAEWYWAQLKNDKPEGRWNEFHNRTYGKDYPYELFASHFTAKLFDPEAWALTIKKSGAKYVVLTSKHHDGYCLWPAPASKNWNSVEIGPKRDLINDLSVAIRKEDLKMGYYYSLHNWFDADYAPADPNGPRNIEKYVQSVMLPQMKDLVTKYKPSLLFTDGEWVASSEEFHSQEFLAWLFNESAAPKDIVVNDRWGKDTRSRHGGYFTTEYGKVDVNGTSLALSRPWEECRGIGASFGFNRNESAKDYLTSQQIVHLLIDIVSRGGNLLLNIGPTYDGRIPTIMEERLLALGDWLKVNGEAIYGSKKWLISGEGPTRVEKSVAQAATTDSIEEFTNKDIRYTQSKDEKTVYAIILGVPRKQVILTSAKVVNHKNGNVKLIGYTGKVSFKINNKEQLIINIPDDMIYKVPNRYAYSFRLTGFEFSLNQKK